MTYPQAPWKLQGYALQTLNAVNIEDSRSFVPPELEIISIFPGKTLGGVYLSAYESGSILEYNELIVVAALVSYKGKIGSWISHIYVDNEDSVAGGREIWGLPKEMAQFTWTSNSVSVSQQEKQLCSKRMV
jgi:acetoacetate decarboxylase